MQRFYSNGKLLITGEYVVLDESQSLALPTKLGQDLIIKKSNQKGLQWIAKNEKDIIWFEAFFDLEKFRLESATYHDSEDGPDIITDTLMQVLQEAKKMNSKFLQLETGLCVETNLSFPRTWGLGSSSTFINNVASWSNVNAFELLWNAFSGSGYDIACAQTNSPIIYQLNNKKPLVEEIYFNPVFKNQLYFVHLNKKQDSREGIKRYKSKRGRLQNDIEKISLITNKVKNCNNLLEFEELLLEHENIISSIVELPKVKDQLFSDYFGVVKSLGAWGGDFVLATGNEDTPKYFKNKGFETVICYSDLIL